MKSQKNNTARGSYVLGATMRLLERVSEKELRADFEKKYAKEIDTLYQRYLSERAMEKESQEHPVLNKKIKDTNLSGHVKKVLQSPPAMFKTMEEVVCFKPEELLSFPGLGPKVVETLKKFFQENGVDYC